MSETFKASSAVGLQLLRRIITSSNILHSNDLLTPRHLLSSVNGIVTIEFQLS